MEQVIQISNRLGLHARAAAKLVQLAKRYSSDIKIIKDKREVDAKSIMSVLMLAATQGSQVAVTADGTDEREALSALVSLIENKFDEQD